MKKPVIFFMICLPIDHENPETHHACGYNVCKGVNELLPENPKIYPAVLSCNE